MNTVYQVKLHTTAQIEQSDTLNTKTMQAIHVTLRPNDTITCWRLVCIA